VVAEPTAGQSQTAWNRQTCARLYAVYSVRVGQEGGLRNAIEGVNPLRAHGNSAAGGVGQRGDGKDGGCWYALLLFVEGPFPSARTEDFPYRGAPVRDYSGKVVASLSVARPTSRLPEEKIPPLAAAVMRAANELSAELGSRPPPGYGGRRTFSLTTTPQEAKEGQPND
jgi:Bacterial transcriptional regulator